MKPYFETETGCLFNGDVFDEIHNLKDKSVQSIITSPPYYGLRNYGCEKQIGLEATYQEYIAKLVTIFEESKRVLKDDGLLFVNISDSFAGTQNKNNNEVDAKNPKGSNIKKSLTSNIPGIKRKSLIGIPQRLQIAMIDNGWICRNVIIWQKPNAMPESVKDRFTIDFEYIFMFSKSRFYKFNQIKEPMITKDRTSPRGSKGIVGPLNSGIRKQDMVGKTTYTGLNDRFDKPIDLMRNKRAVWSVSTKGTKESHFAVFPEELIEPLILCSTDPGDVVFDMHMGSGTVAKMAEVNNRKWIGIELNKEYCDLIKNRLKFVQRKLF